MALLNEDSEVVRWLRGEREARGLARIELSASLQHRASLYDDMLVLTSPDGAVTFGALPEAQRAGVRELLRQHHGEGEARGDLTLSITCEAHTPPRIQLLDAVLRQEQAREQARAEAHFDTRPYGRALAQRVAELMDAGADLSITMDPREGVSRALWKTGDGAYAHGFQYIQGDSQPQVTFASRDAFIRWLGEQSDESLAKADAPEDPLRWGLATFNRAYFARKTGRRA
jgi:hypothetical protein